MRGIETADEARVPMIFKCISVIRVSSALTLRVRSAQRAGYLKFYFRSEFHFTRVPERELCGNRILNSVAHRFVERNFSL